MITFDLGGLNNEGLEQALKNRGYDVTNDHVFPQAGIQGIISVHPKHGFGEQQEWIYEIVWNDDGSFEPEDSRKGFLFVFFDRKDMRVVAEF